MRDRTALHARRPANQSAGREDAGISKPALPDVDGYDILAELGHGGMGVVYKARHRRLNRLVALKMIRAGHMASPEERLRFLIEAEAVAKLRHPNIIQIYDTGESGGLPFVTLELLEGGGLDASLGDTPQPGPPSAKMMATLARAIHEAHRAGIVHRDLKPSNILFARDGTPKVTDFGLARRLGEGGPTETGQVLGSPGYIPPEQARGEANKVGRAADVYALGAILYKMLTGRPPFQGATPLETIIQVLHQDPVPPSSLRCQVPRDLETICLKCLAKEPHVRYPTAEALAEELERYVAGRPIHARPIPPWDRGLKWARRRPMSSSLIAVAVLLGSVLPWAMLRHRGIVEERERRLAVRIAEQRRDGERTLSVVRDHLLVDRITDEDNASLHELRARLGQEPRLADLRDRATELLEQARGRQADIRSKESGRERYREFVRLRDEALFLDAELTGHDSPGNVKTLRESARAALGLFAADDTRGEGWTLASLPSSLTEQEREEVALGCYEMLMVLAEATAMPRPGETAELQARDAIRVLDRSAGLRRQPTHAYHLRRADCLERAGDAEGAMHEHAAAGRIKPDGAFDHFLSGLELYKRGRPAQASRHFQVALQVQPGHFWAQCLLAICSLNDRPAHPDEARAYLTACLQTHPDLPWLYLLRGIASGQSGAAASTGPEAALRFEAAEGDFREALRRDPAGRFRYALLANRGLTRFQGRRWEDAAADLREAVALDPHQYSAYVTLAQVYRRQRKLDLAQEQLDLAIALKPDLASLRRTRALWNLERPEPTEAMRAEALLDLEEAIRCNTAGVAEQARDHAKRGYVLLLDGRPAEALDACEMALRIQPDDAEARRLRLAALLKMERYDHVIDACDGYLRPGSPSADLLELRGLAKVKRNDTMGAIEDYTLAISLRRGSPTLHCRRGWAYLAQGAAMPARHDFDEALRLDSSCGEAYGGRASALVATGQLREAAADAERAAHCPGVEPRTLYNAARSLAQVAEAASGEVGRRGRSDAATARLHQDRALQILNQTIDCTAPAQRAAFWRDVVETDHALRSIRRLPGYSRLAEQCGRLPRASTAPGSRGDRVNDPDSSKPSTSIGSRPERMASQEFERIGQE